MLVGARPEERHVAERVVPEPAHRVALLGNPVFGREDCLIQQVDRRLLLLRCLGQVEGAPGNLVEREGIDVPIGELRGPLIGLHRRFGVAHPEVELANHEVGLRQILGGREVHGQRLEHLSRAIRVVGLEQVCAEIEEHRVNVGVGVPIVGVQLRVERDGLLRELLRVVHVVRGRLPIGGRAGGVLAGQFKSLITTIVAALLVVPRTIVVEFRKPEEIVGARPVARRRRGDEVPQPRESRLCTLNLLDRDLLRHHPLGVGRPLLGLLEHALARSLGREGVVLDLRLALGAAHLRRGRCCKHQQQQATTQTVRRAPQLRALRHVSAPLPHQRHFDAMW